MSRSLTGWVTDREPGQEANKKEKGLHTSLQGFASPPSARAGVFCVRVRHLRVQGCSKRWAPGCVNFGEKLRFVYLLLAGNRNFFTSFSHNLGSIFYSIPFVVMHSPRGRLTTYLNQRGAGRPPGGRRQGENGGRESKERKKGREGGDDSSRGRSLQRPRSG